MPETREGATDASVDCRSGDFIIGVERFQRGALEGTEMTGGYIDDRDKLRMELLAVNTGTMWSVRLILQGGKRLMGGNTGLQAIQKQGQGREEGGGGHLEMLLLPQKRSKG